MHTTILKPDSSSNLPGVESCDYHDVLSRDINATPKYLATGTPMCMAANRLSYFFNLSGPSIAMDTACSSTMVALHQAVRALQHGDSGMALVCGAKLIITPNMFVPSTELGFLSASGRCRSFDAEADGYGRGEGVIALLLKPLTTALADSDPVRAVIKGIRLNQDGRTQGITLPSASAQRDNMEKLYSELGISSDDIQYLEAHVGILTPSRTHWLLTLHPSRALEQPVETGSNSPRSMPRSATLIGCSHWWLAASKVALGISKLVQGSLAW
jgi:acyl transferase domain-containing protein